MQNIQRPTSYTKSRTKTFDLVITAILAALVFVATMFINLKLPIGQGGLIHLGTSMLFISAILFGPKKGALAGAIGMGLFDIVGGWLIWAPTTIISRALQGFIVGKIAWSKGHKGDNLGLNILGAVVSMPVASIPGDVIQNIVGLVIAIPVCVVLKKTPYFKNNF